jgi:hypothetical protein
MYTEVVHVFVEPLLYTPSLPALFRDAAPGILVVLHDYSVEILPFEQI